MKNIIPETLEFRINPGRKSLHEGRFENIIFNPVLKISETEQ